MYNFSSQVRLYSDLTIYHIDASSPFASRLLIKEETFMLSNQTEKDNNTQVFNLEVLLVSLLLLALPIVIYLAYRYGKRIGRKEHVSDAQYYFGQPNNKKTSPAYSSDEGSFRTVNSQTSSTASSPALNSCAQNQLKEPKENMPSSPFTFCSRKDEAMVQTEDNIDDFRLNDESKTSSPQLDKLKGEKERSEAQDGLAIRLNPILEKKESIQWDIDNLLQKHAQSAQKPAEDSREVKPIAQSAMLKYHYGSSSSSKDCDAPKKTEKLQLSGNKMKSGENGALQPMFGLRRYESHNEIRYPMEGLVVRGRSEVLPKKSVDFLNEMNYNAEKQIKIESVVEKYELPDETGKFNKMFKNAERIGEGSFGEVYKVRIYKLTFEVIV